MASSLHRFLGGSAKIVALKLVLVSIGVGVLLSFAGLNPYRLLYSLEYLFHVIWENSFDLIDRLWRYFLLGAAIVVPIWLIMRVFATKSPAQSQQNHSLKDESGVEKHL